MIVIGLLVLSWAGNTRTARPIGWGFNMLSWKRRDDVLRRRRRHPTVAAHRNFAGIELRPTVFKSDGMGRERKVRGFHSYDSGKGKASGRGSAPSSHGCGHGSSWGAWLRQGEGGARAGAGGGGYQGAHRGRNRTKMARLGRSTAAFVTLFLLEEQRRGN